MDRYSLDVEPSFECEIDDFYVEGEPLCAQRREQYVGDIAANLLVANLTGYLNLLPMLSSDGVRLAAQLSALKQPLPP